MTSVERSPDARRDEGDRARQLHQEPFRLLVESVVDYAIYMLDPPRDLESWNMGAERLKGYTPDEIPRGALLDLVRARASRSRVMVEIADEGEGIPEELLPHVFERFKHGRRGGTGLGLWIVKQYVELHGGEVSVETAPELGTTFEFSLPAA